MRRLPILLTASIIAFPLTSTAVANVLVLATETNRGVQFLGNGTLNLTDLAFVQSASGSTAIRPNLPAINFSDGPLDIYSGLAGPDSFGAGTIDFADAVSGDNFGITQLEGPSGSGPLELIVPIGSSSNLTVSAEMIFENESFASLGMEEGIYVWTWGSGSNADSFTLNVVPEPASLLSVTGTLIVLVMRRRKCQSAR